MNTQNSTPRPVSVTHLVLGLIFLGLALVWVVGALTEAEAPRAEIAGPAVLIGAGVIGLVATVANARTRRTRREADSQEHDNSYADNHAGSYDNTEEIR